MSITTKIKDLYGGDLFAADKHYVEFKNLLMNAVKIEGTEELLDYPTETFIKSVLIDDGVVGYDKLTKKWACIYGEGRNEIGNPTRLNFVFRNGNSFMREASYKPVEDGAYRIMALPIGFSLGQMIQETTKFMNTCENAMLQNVEACKTPYIVVCKDKDLQLSIEHAIQQKQNGQAVLIVSEDLGEGLKSVDVSVQFMADKFIDIRDKERDRLLNKLGIMSANINKKERVQVGEVNATLGQCVDYIYLLIDTFNKQMETYELPFKMFLNGALEELYEENNEHVDEQEDQQEITDDPTEKEGAN